jgi:hypothetical protein
LRDFGYCNDGQMNGVADLARGRFRRIMMVPEVRSGVCQERDGCNDAENNYARSVCGGFWRVNHDVIEAAASEMRLPERD